ncbi:uncharacterized protein [Miscanthus floridulus]|uniref:uncharacterized protein n=1 Tax=Miscanthus floridulus TaxID=154761 RepID=UPI003459DFC3
MAEIVSSAVVQETVSQVLSNLVQKNEEKDESNKHRNLERLEMAHTRLEAVLEISDGWQITDASLLRWRSKLKRAAQECEDTLYGCKKRVLEEEQMEEEVRNSSFPRRIAHATKSFIFSTLGNNSYESSRSIIRRFEWFADGASEFLRYVELGGTTRCGMPFDPLIRHLLTGKKLEHKFNPGNGCPNLFLQLVPFITAAHGIEAILFFMQKDSNVPEDNFFLSIMLQLSESTDIVGIAVKCLQLFDPLFKSTAENIRKKLTLLPTEDLSWVPYGESQQKEHWDNLLSFATQWFRPNPLCCKQRDPHEARCSSKVQMSGIPDVSLEPVIEVNLQCHVSPSAYNSQKTSPSRGRLQESPLLKAGLIFMPHGALVNTNSATEAINGEEQSCLNTNTTLQQLEEMILPKAIDYFHQNAKASAYQTLWNSKHGTAYVQVENAILKNQSTWRTRVSRARKGKPLKRVDQELESQTYVIPHFLDLWAAHAPIRLQDSIADWIQKEKENQLALSEFSSFP